MGIVRTGKVTGREVKTNRDRTTARRLLQVQLTDAEDIQTVELIPQHGEDVNPVDGSQCIVLDLGNAFKVAIAINDGVVPTVDIGEKKLYSVASGAIKAFVYIKKDGSIQIQSNTGGNTANIDMKVNGDIEVEPVSGGFVKIRKAGNVEVNGTADFAVAYDDLKAAFDQLKTELNTFVAVYNGHAHPGGVVTPQAVTATADMTAAKVATVLLP